MDDENVHQAALGKLRDGIDNARETAVLDVTSGIMEDEYMADLQKMAAASSSLDAFAELGVGKDLMQAIDGLQGPKQIEVSSSATMVPTISTRQLFRLASDPADLQSRKAELEKERSFVLSKVTAERKKTMQFLHLSNVNSTSLKEALNQTVVPTFKGELNSSHRMIVLSADQALEFDGGWASLPKLSSAPDHNLSKIFKAKLDFALNGFSGPADFTFVFDGRSRAARQVIESSVASVPDTNLAELWITYKGCVSRCSGRAVFGGEHNREVCFLKLPVGRVRINSKEREDPFYSVVNCCTQLAIESH
jgi:hypothetical protein